MTDKYIQLQDSSGNNVYPNVVLPTASTGQLGCVKPDGTTITVDSDGVISGSGTNKVLTVGTKTYNGSSAITITASDLGLSNALHFIGVTSTTMSDGITTSPITVNSQSITPSAGDVVIDSSSQYEYVWTGSAWERLGGDSSYALNTNATTSSAGLMSATDKSKLDGIASRATANTGTVTSIATSGAITGGTITTSGTISHSTANGYKHIPAGGSENQILGWSADGTASWQNAPEGGGIIVSGNEPSGDSSMLWIDTDNNAVAKYWNGSAWKPIGVQLSVLSSDPSTTNSGDIWIRS